MQYYFEASKFSLETAFTQQGYLYACLSDSVQVELKSRITEDTPVFGPVGTSSCVNTLTALWQQRHPRYNRRMSFINAKQAYGEGITQFLDRLEDMAQDCEVATMTTDDWLVQVAIMGITDKRANTKFNEAKQPDYQALREIGLQIEQARAQSQKPQAEAASSARVFASPATKSHSTEKGSKSSPKKSSQKKAAPQQCSQCGASDHSDRNLCPVFQKAMQCHKCGKTGHLQKVCRSAAASGASSASSKGAKPKKKH